MVDVADLLLPEPVRRASVVERLERENASLRRELEETRRRLEFMTEDRDRLSKSLASRWAELQGTK